MKKTFDLASPPSVVLLGQLLVIHSHVLPFTLSPPPLTLLQVRHDVLLVLS